MPLSMFKVLGPVPSTIRKINKKTELLPVMCFAGCGGADCNLSLLEAEAGGMLLCGAQSDKYSRSLPVSIIK